MKRLAIALISALAVTPALHAAVLITDFGSGGTRPFTPNGSTFDPGDITITSSLIQVIGLTDDVLKGDFDSVDLTLIPESLTLNARVQDNPGGSLFITLFDEQDETATYEVLLNDFESSSFKDASAVFVSNTLGFEFNNVRSASFAFSDPALNIDIEFASLTATIPEPSTYALIGVGGLALWVLRRRSLRC
jgi:hypothetical protein